MTRTKDREKAVALRKRGYSYSMIKNELNISKSTLSGWLSDLPLPKDRINELQSRSQVRIEKSRNTKKRNKDARRKEVYIKVANDIESNQTPEFLAGFYLYWGEGTKTSEYTIALTNTDPAIIKCFVLWICKFGIPVTDLRIKLHLYSDQNEDKLKIFWSEVTGIPTQNYYKSYCKNTKLIQKTHKGMFSFGTCSVIYHDRDMYEYIIEGIRYLRDKYS